MRTKVISIMFVCVLNMYAQRFQSLQDAQNYFAAHILEIDPIEGVYDVDYSFDGYAPLVGPRTENAHGVFAIYKEANGPFKYVTQKIEGGLGIASIERLGESDIYILNRWVGGTGKRAKPYIRKARFRLDDVFYFEVIENESQALPGGVGTIKITYSFLKRFPTKNQYQAAIQEAKDKMQKENESSEYSLWTGTGFALNNGYVVTNNHVVEGATSIKIYGVRGNFDEVYNAKVVGTDKVNDLALLKMDSYPLTNSDVIPYSVKFSMSEVGEDVFVLGYPLTQLLGNEIKLTNGIISSRTGFDGNVNNYQMSAPVQPGNSGGPVFDKNGNVIGIVVAGIDNKVAQNANYAIKTSCLANLVESVADKSIFPKGGKLAGLSLSLQTKKAKDYVYYIECTNEIASQTNPSQEIEIRKESVRVVDGGELSNYSVVLKMYAMQRDAEALREKIAVSSSSSRIVAHISKGILYGYYVIYSTHFDKESAIAELKKVIKNYPHAWILEKE